MELLHKNVLPHADGSLFVSDESAGFIYRIFYVDE
jgi:hypothetical protein